MLSMDVCLHPEHLWNHGQFVSHDKGPSAQSAMIPEFAWCSTTLHHDITVPTLYGWLADAPSDDPEWEDKIDERLVWRGANTGIAYVEGTRWKNSHRTVLLEKTNAIEGTSDVLRSSARDERVGEAHTLRNVYINPAMFDVGFVGSPDCGGSVCSYLQSHYPSKNRQSDRTTWQYKYIMDVSSSP